MKFLHISDLHFGKKLNEFSLIEDQRFIIYKILQCIDEIKPDAVLIAGDVYDKGIPSVEAVKLFDDFLCRLAERKLQVFIISGNHDSPERMTCGASLMETSGIHFAPVYDGTVCKYQLDDKNGPVNIYLLPFIKPAVVKEKCISCGFCEKNCPVNGKAVHMIINKRRGKPYPKYEYDKCIKCFCCQEMCPAGAIITKRFTI